MQLLCLLETNVDELSWDSLFDQPMPVFWVLEISPWFCISVLWWLRNDTLLFLPDRTNLKHSTHLALFGQTGSSSSRSLHSSSNACVATSFSSVSVVKISKSSFTFERRDGRQHFSSLIYLSSLFFKWWKRIEVVSMAMGWMHWNSTLCLFLTL